MRFRKQERSRRAPRSCAATPPPGEDPHLLPELPAGLSRYSGDAGGVDADYIVVEMAKHILGENWMADYVAKANNGGIERVLL